MSSAPVGTSSPLISCSAAREPAGERHAARADADEGDLVEPRLRSRISWAMRVSARDIRSASITCGMGTSAIDTECDGAAAARPRGMAGDVTDTLGGLAGTP